MYHALDTSAYIEIPREAIVYLEEEESSEPGAIRAFVRASGEILSVRRYRIRAADWAHVRVANWPLQLPPPQPSPSFWTCAGGCESRFAALASDILRAETRCLAETNSQRQQLCLGQIAERKSEAKRALYFCLSRCVDTYGAPPVFIAVPDASAPSGFRMEPFSLGGYHAMLVTRHLEKPE